jgi:hypothetical protein
MKHLKRALTVKAGCVTFLFFSNNINNSGGVDGGGAGFQGNG